MWEQIKALPKWAFLNEPIWKWFVFLVAMGMIMAAWRSILVRVSGAI